MVEPMFKNNHTDIIKEHTIFRSVQICDLYSCTIDCTYSWSWISTFPRDPGTGNTFVVTVKLSFY